MNFSFNDFKLIFCYNQKISDLQVEIDDNYQEILDSMQPQELLVERKFYDLSKDYIVRECLLFHLIKIQSQVPDKELLLICQEYIKRLWLIEKDESVRALLKNKEIVEMQKQLFSHDLKSFSTTIQEEMNQKLKQMEAYEQKIRFEGNQSYREKLQQQLSIQYEEFEEFLVNITEMSQQLDITLIFLKEMQKNIKQIKQKIEDLQESLKEISNDIRKLRGKKYSELLLIRKERVLQQAYLLELDSVYIALKTQEINPVTGEIQKTFQGSDFSELLVDEIQQNKKDAQNEGEVNQFIYEEQEKDVMLIKGQAGSGKSRSARKIEQYLWKQNKDQYDWIPIYISLPQLKNPKFNLIDQALESENYGFDKLQLKDFKEAISKQNIRVVMILDSYDEMKQDCIQSNLIQTNRLIQELDLNTSNKVKKAKFIITTRKEILTSLGYQTQFFGESIQTFKEVEIMNFDQEQSEKYLQHYVNLSIKRRIKFLYDFVKQIKQQQQDIKEFLEIWNKITDQVLNQDVSYYEDNSSQLLDDEQIENILQILKKCSAFQYVQEDQLIILKKELISLWSVNLYQQTIQNLKIEHFVQTPFMLEIIVQTLPNLSKKYKGSNEIKELFQKNFLLLKKKDNLSKKLIEKYLQQEQDEKEVQIQQNIVQLNQIENDSEDYQVQKDLKIILEQLESQRFFENYSITDIKLAEDQILKLQQIDDMKFVIPALKMKQFTIYEFYQNFIEFYHDQQIQKLRQLGKVDNVDSFTIDLIQFSESLALEMTINQITQVNYEQKGRLKLTNHYFDQNDQDNWKMQYFDDLEDEYKKLVRSSALITMKGKSYSFNHKSIQEFYVAQHINNLLNKLELVNNQFTQNSQMFLQKSSLNQSQFNISFQNYAGSLSILKQKLKYDDLIKAKLISMAKLSKKNEFTTASSNSFSLLSYLQVYLGEQDFSNIQIQNTTFIGLSFYKSNFQSSRLKGVVIDSCLFDQANLAEAQWEQLVCSEKPLLQGHQGKIIVLQYTNEGQYIITGDSNKVIKFWEVKTYQQKAEIQQITGEPQILVLSSDSHLLFIAQSNNIIESWIISDLNNIKKTGHSIRKEDTIISMQLSQNEKELYVVDKQGLVQFWDVNLIKAHSNEKDGFAIQSGDSDIKKIEFFQNGEYIASDSDDYNVRIWNVEKQQQIALIKMPSPIINLKIIQSVQYLVCITGSSYSQQYYNIWSIKSIDQPEFLFRSSKYQIHSIQFTSDDKQLLYEVEDAVIIQNTSDICNQEEYYKLNNCLCVAFSSNNNLIASGNNDQIIFWDLDTQVIINSLNHESYSIEELIFISNGTKLLSAHYSGDLKLWSVQRCVLIANYKECYQKRNITISSDSDIIAIETKRRMAIISLTQKQSQQNTNQLYYFELNPISISYDDELILHDYSNWNEQQYYVTNPGSYQQIQFENHKNKFKCGIFANQSLLFASFSEDSKIRIWTYQGLIFQKMIEIEFECQISKMQFSFDDKYLALVIDMNLIKIWEYGKQKFYELKQVIHQDTDLCFSFNSLQLAFFTNDEIKIWKFSVDEQTYIIKNDENHEIKAIASSPKVNLFATSFIQQTIIIIWDFETRQKLYTILSDEQVNSLCFSYDGEYLVSGGQILRLWNLQNFSKIKLNGASEYICDYEIKKVCSLHQTQGITVISSSRKMGKIQFKDFEFIGILEQSQRLLTRCEFSLDNQFIVGGLDKQVVIWNINNNYQIEFRHDFLNTVQSVRFCQDQKRLIVAQESDICFLDINSGNIMNVFSDLKQIKDAQTFNGDQYLYTKQEKFVKIWKLQNQPILIDYFSLPHQSVKFLQDGKFLSHCETDSITVYPIYPIQTQSKLRFIHLQQLRKIKISSNSKYILYGDWQNLILSDFKSNEVIEELSSYETFEFCPDNLNIIVIERGILMIYNIMDKKIINQLNLDEKSYRNHIQFSNDGKTLVLATSCIMLFNIEDISKPQFIGVIQDVNRLADPTISQKYLASIIKKNQIILTDLRNRKFMKSFQVKKGYSQLDDLVFFSNYEKAAYLSSNSFIVKDLKYDKIECETGQKFECQQIAISKNTKNLIFSSKNQIYIYEQDQKVYTEFNKLDENVEYIINFSFSQDSQYLVGCGSNKIIYYWDFKARKVIAKFQGHSEIVKVAKISKDNSTLASGSFDKLIRLWNLQGNFSRTIQDGHERRVNHFEFSADSLILYSGSEDKTLKFWDMQNNILSLSKDFEFIIFSFSISMDQKSLLITQGGTVELWYIQQSQTMQKSNSEIIPNGCRSYNVSIKAHIQKIQFLPNEDYFITLSINNYKQQGQQYEFSLAEIWNLQKLDEDIYPQLYQYNNITIELYQVSEDGKYVCFLDSDNELTLGYNFEIQEDNQFQKVNQLKKYNTSKIFSVAFSNDSSILSSADNLSIVFRRLQEDQLIGYFSIKIETDCFFQFFLNDNKFYYTNYQNKIFLWDVDNMIKDLQFSISEVKLDLEHLDILCFTISNNLKLLILGLQENQLRYSLSVVEMQDNKIIKTLDQNSKINILLFSDDDILLALSNELCEILIYTTEQFIIKHQLKCHQTKIIKIMFFYEETKILIEENKENNNEDKQIERFNESNQVEKIESKESDNNQDINKDHKLVQILSIISFDKNGTVVINNLEQQMIEKKPFTIQVNPDMQIQQIVLTKDIQRLAVIKQNEVQNFECSILRWDLEECYEQQKIQNCKIAQFNLDQQYLIYCTEYGDLYANYLKLKKEIKLFDSRDASQPFSILILFTTGKSILFAGNTEQILCWQIHTLENQIELIFLKKLEINQLNVLTMVINQESQIFCIGDNKIQRLDFSNAIGKLKACLIYYAEKEQMYEYQEKELIVPNIHFQNCNFSSDLSLCICVGKGNIFVDRYRNSYSRTKEQKESFTYLILWNVKTLRFTVLEESFVTKFSSDYEMFQLLMYFNDIAVFFPNKKIIVSNRDHEIIFRDCLNIDDTEFNYLNVIATINHKERIKNLIVSKDENWLASICEIGVFCLWNIIDLSKIMLTRVIYFSQEIKGFKFTNDICCYSMNLPTKDNKIYKLEYLDLKNYLAKRAFISYDYFLDFSIMPKSSIIALCGVDLILWNYETDQQKKVDLQGNSDSSINQVAFGNNNILAAAKGCDIHLIQISADTLEFNQINKLSSEQGQITCIQILRNNTILVSGSDDKTIRFWSLEQFSIIAILDGFVDTIKMITVSPNSTDMAVAMMDGSIRLYNLSFPKNFHDLTSEQIGKNAKYIQCYKIFGRQNLISAKNCIFQNTIIQQDGKALQTLFQQKNAIMMDPKQQNQN